MATNGNRWAKERGGKNPLDRARERAQADKGGAIELEAGGVWEHKLTGLRFTLEALDEELALLSPEDPNGTPLEVQVAQFREQFTQSPA